MKSPLNFLYSLYFNFRYMPFNQAVHLPIWVTTNLRECKLHRDQIIIMPPVRCKQILIGGGKSPGLQAYKAGILIADGGRIVFRGKAVISQGTVLRCDKQSIIEFGSNFYCNSNCYMRSTNTISFGNDCSLGWNITLNTSDGHLVWHSGNKVQMEEPITIGDNVWITPHSSIAKGSHVPSNCIVAQGAVVTKKFTEQNCMIGGVPARVVAHDIDWHA